jgi:hypothetical protein
MGLKNKEVKKKIYSAFRWCVICDSAMYWDKINKYKLIYFCFSYVVCGGTPCFLVTVRGSKAELNLLASYS